MEAATAVERPPDERAVSSFAKSLFLGEIHEQLVFPFPMPDPEEQDQIRSLVAALCEMPYDPRRVEEERWIGDETVAELGERGLGAVEQYITIVPLFFGMIRLGLGLFGGNRLALSRIEGLRLRFNAF